MKLLLSGATLLLFFGLFGCSNDDSGGSVFCSSTQDAPSAFLFADFTATITSASVDFCQDTNGTYTGRFESNGTYTLTYQGSEGCDDTSGTFVYAADGNTGTITAAQTSPEATTATLALCVTNTEAVEGEIGYVGNYILTAESAEGNQTGDFDLVVPDPVI